MRFVVTGATGFIGKNFVREILDREHHVSIIGNESKKISEFKKSFRGIEVVNASLDDLNILKTKLNDFDVVVHFAANASTQNGLENTDLDLKRGILWTYNILESMRVNNIKKIIFPSAPAIYGYPIKIPTTEDTGMLLPVSLYGASKLASEGMISAYSNLFDMKSWIFRLGNVIGPHMERGVIRDFITKLKKDPKKLYIFGNGKQKKDFIHINDCVEGILFAFERTKEHVNIFNLSSGSTTTINKIADIIIKEMGLKDVMKEYSYKENIGWKGDVPEINDDISKISKIGWNPKYNSEQAIRLIIKGMI